MNLWKKLRRVIVLRILGLGDTPHRIAWGVFLGFVVAFSPTIGLQMTLYLIVATLFRANKVAGLPIVWITNPFTAVPVYYSCWWLGNLVLNGGADSAVGFARVQRAMGAGESSAAGFWSRLLEADFWRELGSVLWDMGAELWLGGFLVGLLLGAAGYALTYFGVIWYRERLERRRAEGLPDEDADEEEE